MSLKLITPATALPLVLADVKLYLKVDHDAEDALITSLIEAATQNCEHILQRSIMPQTWELVLDAFPAGDLELFKLPVASITSVKYVLNEAEQTLAADQYVLDGEQDQRAWLLSVNDWPSTDDVANAVRVRYVAGYADTASVPAPIKHWLMLTVADYYHHRGTMTLNPVSNFGRNFYDGLLDRFRVYAL